MSATLHCELCGLSFSKHREVCIKSFDFLTSSKCREGTLSVAVRNVYESGWIILEEYLRYIMKYVNLDAKKILKRFEFGMDSVPSTSSSSSAILR